jgi:hypothetical protein
MDLDRISWIMPVLQAAKEVLRQDKQCFYDCLGIQVVKFES